MTPEEWQQSTDPAAMLQFLRDRGGDTRKVRFFIIACLVRSLASYGGLEDSPVAKRVRRLFDQQLASPDLYAAATEASEFAAEAELDGGGMTPSNPGWVHVYPGQLEEHANVLQDVVGNLFHEVVFDPSWHTPAVAELVSHIDRNGAFDLMPALGAALSDAGCKDL